MKKWNPKAHLKPPDKKPEELSMEAQWREEAKAIVTEVIERTKGQPPKAMLKALREAYPFGSRQPARIWGAEVSRQRKLLAKYNDPRQVKLFEDA